MLANTAKTYGFNQLLLYSGVAVLVLGVQGWLFRKCNASLKIHVVTLYSHKEAII